MALIELLAGVIVGNAFHLDVPGWLAFLGSFAGMVLIFQAGVEVDVPQFRREWRLAAGVPRSRDARPSSVGDASRVVIATQLRHRRLLLGAAAACYAGVFASFVVFERSGLGIGHFFYVAIVVAAMATGVLGGAVAGLVATALYALGVYLNSHLPTGTIPTEATAIRLVTYSLVGGLIGYYASHSRALLARADELTEELRALARRDFVTGLPNQRAFEIAVSARIEEGQPFVLVVCDLPPVPRGADERNQALAFGERLGGAVGPESGVARIGNGQFAAVVPVGEEQAGEVTDRVEVAIGSHGRRGTVGWATFPRDGADALGLYTSAAERLYARKISRGEWELPATVTPIDR